MLGRYFYFESNGSTANNSNHITEIQIFNKSGENIALNKGVYRTNHTGTISGIITDGNTSTSPYVDLSDGAKYVVIDLGNIYDVSRIKIWRYYSDGRTYRDIFIKVSIDDVDYTTVFSSEVDGLYKETSEGKQIDLPLFDQKKYLIKSGVTIYTLIDGVLTVLENAELNKELFITHGFDSIDNYLPFANLSNPELLCWIGQRYLWDGNCTLGLNPPKPQSIVTNNINISTDPSISGIANVICECEGSPLFSCEFNGVWKEFDGTAWIDEESGMSVDIIESITPEQWNEMIEGLEFFRVKIILNNIDDKVSKIKINFIYI